MSATEGAEGWVSEFDTPTSDETEWTAANIQEALPGLVTPMSWSLIQPLLTYGFARPAQRMGAYVPPKDPYVAQFYSRAYLNATTLREGAKKLPGGSPEAVDEQYLGRQRDPTKPAWRPSLRDLIGYVPVIPRMLWLMSRAEREIAAVEQQVREQERQDRAKDLSGMSPAELVADLEGGLELGREVAATHIGVSGGASSTFEALGRITKSWLGDATGSLQATLVSGLAQVESARPSKALWDLSRHALASDEVSRALDEPDAKASLAGLRASSSEEAKRFVAAYDAFIERFGHRSVLEGELSAPLWEEDTATVFAMVRNLRDTGPDADPYAGEARQRQLREAETRRALAALSPPRRVVFRRVLRMAQDYVANRERTKSLLVKGTQRARHLLRELGDRFVAAGTIAAPDDVFYLTLAEAKRAAHEPGIDFKETVRRRRQEMERNRAVQLPESFVGRPKPVKATAAAGDAVTVLRGIPVSPGKVTGVARVVLDPRLDGHIAEGEVLVAPVTDAGWTPLFLTAAAVVVDIGGPLSHGATVARELGLPAVVNVKQGTKLIRTGQRVTVDGAQGTVTLED
jgi:phosphohistidine swiveling domain-containing protein